MSLEEKIKRLKKLAEEMKARGTTIKFGIEDWK